MTCARASNAIGDCTTASSASRAPGAIDFATARRRTSPGWSATHALRIRFIDHLPPVAFILALVAIASTYVSRRALRRVVHPMATASNHAALRVARTVGAAFEYDPAEEPRPARWELIAGACLGLLLLVPLLLYGPYEEEIVQATILPNQVFYRALFHGEWFFWFHPVFAPLAAFARPEWEARAGNESWKYIQSRERFSG